MKWTLPALPWSRVKTNQPKGCSQSKGAVFQFKGALKDTVETVVGDGVSWEWKFSHERGGFTEVGFG